MCFSLYCLQAILPLLLTLHNCDLVLSLICNYIYCSDKVVYTTVTVGCPTAYRLKYKGGGLVRMQLLPSIMPSVGSYGTSVENKGFRLKSLLGKVCVCLCVCVCDIFGGGGGGANPRPFLMKQQWSRWDFRYPHHLL